VNQGQSMRKQFAWAVILALLLFSFLTPLGVDAQAPEPPNVATLGPPVILSGNFLTDVKIFSPEDQSYLHNPIRLNFSVTAVGMFGQFGNVGYSVDGGVIRSVTEFVNKSVEFEGPDWYWDRTTVFASIVLPTLSDGFYNVTVYYGWQYLGTNNPSLERYEVYAYATVVFAVGKPTIVPPKILVFSPESNLTTEVNSVSLILNVSAPVAVNALQSQLRYVYYEVDWLDERQYIYYQNMSANEHFQSLQLNDTLSNIPNGTHELLIVVCGSVSIRQAMFVEEYDSESNSTIILTVNSSGQPSGNFALSQTQMVSIVVFVFVVVGLGLLVYLKKHIREAEQA
jgi:hypothetical protein